MLMPLSSRRASILFLLMIGPVALLTNFLRVMTLVLVVHHFGTAAEARVHDSAAAAELALSLVLFLLVRRVIEKLFGKHAPAKQAIAR
jgi:exosortase/archaeosortase family protein